MARKKKEPQKTELEILQETLMRDYGLSRDDAYCVARFIEDKLEDTREKAYRHGRDDGYESGYDNGRDDSDRYHNNDNDD